MESLFTKTYRYRQKESKHQLENFVTEIFTFSLKEDIQFRNRFFDLLKIDHNDNYIFRTQQHYVGFGIPDIEIIGDRNHIIIECKILADERNSQLNDYVKILRKKKRQHQWLIYLTKFYEYKELEGEKVNYQNIKWLNIKNLIQEDNNIVTLEFYKFLTENNIAMDKNFNTADLLSLENIGNTISKMDEVLDTIKPYFSKAFGNPSQDAARSTQLKKNAYYHWKNIGDPIKYVMDIGFMWWFENDPHIKLTLRFYINRKNVNSEERFEFLKDKLEFHKWDFTSDHQAYVVAKYLNINEITAKNEEHILKMTSFLKENIDLIHELKQKYPENF